jgi:hypothetical protein
MRLAFGVLPKHNITFIFDELSKDPTSDKCWQDG